MVGRDVREWFQQKHKLIFKRVNAYVKVATGKYDYIAIMHPSAVLRYCVKNDQKQYKQAVMKILKERSRV